MESERRNTAPELVKQRIYKVDRERKRDLLIDLIRDNGWVSGARLHAQLGRGANGLAEKAAQGRDRS